MVVNPFRYETPADRWSFTDREDLLPRLMQLMREPGRRALLHGRRRMGKTSLIHEAARRGKTQLIFVDLSVAATLSEVANKLVQGLPKPPPKLTDRFLGLAQKFFKTIILTGEKISLSGELRSGEGAAESLEQALNLIEESAELFDCPITVALDEFQEITTLMGDRAEWRLRGVMQPHRHVTYLFSGSDRRLLERMTQPKAAFYKQLEPTRVHAIPPPLLGVWIDERTRVGGLADAPFGPAVVEAAGPCTGDIVRLAKTVFDLMAAGKRAHAIEVGMDYIIRDLRDEFLKHWHPLPQTQRSVLRAVAANQPPLAGETLRRYGLHSASTAQTAIKALVDRQLLIRDEENHLVFDNPFFKHWVKAAS